VQPGGRAPAPGELALVQAFINTHFSLADDWGEDRLASPSGLETWLVVHDLAGGGGAPLSRLDLARALAVREGLRALAAANGQSRGNVAVAELAALNDAAAGAAVELRLSAAGPRFVAHPGAALDEAIGRLLTLTATAMVDGTWARLKVCPGAHCGWAFYDHSRNASGRWCSMSVCGGRAKARAHYRRRVAVDERRGVG
jgi:predicted RNA-binding Zn ribbon-like protein